MNRHHRAMAALATLALLPVFAPSAARAATECLGTPIMGGYEVYASPYITIKGATLNLGIVDVN